MGQPVIDSSGAVDVGSTDTRLYRLDATTLAPVWSFPTGNAITGAAAVGSNGVVYVGSADTFVYAVEGATGALLWSYNIGVGGWSSTPSPSLPSLAHTSSAHSHML